jgi:MFS-type transporter involved in bile tolerance (Atg22 family)
VLKHPVLRNVFAAQTLLRFFYAWMVIYTPLYLSQYIGFSWSQIGIMFSIMLLPFLILELPLGKVVDSAFGEKKIMVFGFVLLVATVACIPFLTTSTFAVWTGVLFTSRIGAACVEMATESYFFKHVNGSLADTISLFRMARPATYVAVSAVATLTLGIISLQWSFLILAVIMVIGVPLALTLRNA